MKFWIGLIAALFISQASAQVAQTGAGRGTTASGCSDTDVVAWEAAVVSAGGTTSATQDGFVCTLVGSLKSHSLWSTLDRLWLHASENTQQATIDLVARVTMTTTAAPTFTASQGFTGNGSTQFYDTLFGPSVNGVNYTQNSAQVSSYIRTSNAAANAAAIAGYNDGGTGTAVRFLPYAAGNVIIDEVNGLNSFPQFANPAGTSQGFYTVSRTGIITTDVYRNSNSTSLNTDTTAAAALFTTTLYILAEHLDSTNRFFSADEIAITVIGGGLSGANAAQMQTDLNTYMTSLGKNVY